MPPTVFVVEPIAILVGICDALLKADVPEINVAVAVPPFKIETSKPRPI